jgi:hypothetical protein
MERLGDVVCSAIYQFIYAEFREKNLFESSLNEI